MLKLNIEKTFGFISKEAVAAYEAEVKAAQEALEKGTRPGNDFLGWLHLPSSITAEHLADLNATAQVLRENCEVVVVAGIGGSYLGARAAIEFINSPLYNNLKKDTPDIYFVGNNISSTYLSEVISIIEGRDFSINVISKSGTTTEPADEKKGCGGVIATTAVVMTSVVALGVAFVTKKKED